jgi:hypothetical protein
VLRRAGRDGRGAVDANLVPLVKRLLDARVRKDPDRPGRYRHGVAHADLRGWESHQVVLD